MKLSITFDDAALHAMLTGYPERVVRSVSSCLQRLTIMIQRRVKEKLSGEVLHVRTGTLRRSINQEVRVAGRGLIEGIVGTNIEYAPPHEYGFHGGVTVRAHMRRITTNRKSEALGKMPKKGGYALKNKFWKGTAEVREHTRRVDLPERSFLRSTLRDYRDQISTDLGTAAADALKGRAS